eukprot:jgi/Picre1/35940/NNA_003397.t1
MADCLEGSVAYTPPLTPLGNRSNLGMLGVHSSPDLSRARSRPQSMDLNTYDFSAMVDSKQFMLPKPQSSGSLCHRTAFAFDHTAYDQKSSGAASPHRVSNNSESQSVLSSEGSELMERYQNPPAFGKKKIESVHTAPRYPDHGGQYLKEAAQYLDVNPTGLANTTENKSIGVCDAGIRDILQAFDITSRVIDVSRHGLGPAIMTDGSVGMLQSKSVQALQHFHSRRNSSDAGSDSAFGDALLENAVKMSFGRVGSTDIDYEVVAQVQPDLILMLIPEKIGSSKIQKHVREKIYRASRRTKLIEFTSHSLADVLQHIVDIGDAIHERDQAVAIVKKVRERLRKVVMYSQKAKLTSPAFPRYPRLPSWDRCTLSLWKEHGSEIWSN